jgi:O-acetyl-ADP-ribose deacetylase (regulator of RNase III)
MPLAYRKIDKVILRPFVDQPISAEGWRYLFNKKETETFDGEIMMLYGPVKETINQLIKFGFNGPDHPDPDLFKTGTEFLYSEDSYCSDIKWAEKVPAFTLTDISLPPEYRPMQVWRKRGSENRGVHWKDHVLVKGYDVDWYPFMGKIGKGRLKVIQGDITEAKTRAIVTPANTKLQAVGEVGRAIHKAAGPRLIQKRADMGEVKEGNAIRTNGFDFCYNLIHAVAPNYHKGQQRDPQILNKTYSAIFREARNHAVYNIAIPLISTGVHGFPLLEEAQLAVQYIRKWQNGIDVEIWCNDVFSHSAFKKIVEG